MSAYVGPTQVSVSGPPSTLAAFLATLSRPAFLSTPLPITAPYHATHLYNDADVSRVLERLPAGVAWPSTRVPIVSAARPEPAGHVEIPLFTSFASATREAVRDCLTRPIALDRWPANLAHHIQSRGGSFIATTRPIALAYADRLGPLISSLLPVPSSAPLTPTPPPPSPPLVNSHARAAKSPIAIVAASGRFPQADSMDAFWDVLLRGVDTHEMVWIKVIQHSNAKTDACRFRPRDGMQPHMSVMTRSRMSQALALAVGCTMLGSSMRATSI